jgi:hypothetical protein
MIGSIRSSQPRRTRPVPLLCMFAILAATMPLNAQPDARTADTSVAAGLAFLEKRQADDGSFADEALGAPKASTTGLTLMSFLSAGQVQDVGRYGLTVRRAVDCLVKTALDKTELTSEQRAIVVVALAEAYSVEPDARQRTQIRAAINQGVTAIPDAQDGDDLFTTTWQALSLRAARNIGVAVSQARCDQAVKSILNCYRPEAHGFSDRASGGQVTRGSTAMAVLVLCLLDSPDRPAVADARKSLFAMPIDPTGAPLPRELFFMAEAAAQSIAPTPQQIWEPISRRLISEQSTADGGWPESRAEAPGRIHSTSLAVLTLSVPMRILCTFEK